MDTGPDHDPFYVSHRRRRSAWAAVAVAVALGGVGFVAVPNYMRIELNANESRAIATLKNLSSAQAQLQASGELDVDHNGCGEYGFFAELAAAVPLRGGADVLGLPLLGPAFAQVRNSCIVRNGYVFQIFLPDRQCRGVAADAAGGDPRNDNGVEPAQAERLWCCYAWPLARGWTGNRVFFLDAGGNVLATDAKVVPYEGEGSTVPFDAAFAAGEPARMDAKITVNARGRDGNLWWLCS